MRREPYHCTQCGQNVDPTLFEARDYAPGTCGECDRVVVIAPDGRRTECPYPETLQAWQDHVDGYIEVVHITDAAGLNAILVVNEEGLLLGLPTNALASMLATHEIVGTAVLVEGDALRRWHREG